MKKILITGSSGFLGSNILNYLKKSNFLFATTRVNKVSKNKNLKFLYFKNHKDLNKKLKRIKVDSVIHCATNYTKEHKHTDISKIIKANVEFGNIILENLNKMGVKNFINFCTVWQNFNSITKKPLNLYSASKNAFLEILKFYQNRYNKINFFNLYIADTFGENDQRRKIINVIKNNNIKRKSVNIVSKNLSLNLLNVKDVIRAIIIPIFKNTKSGDYNVINNKNFIMSKLISHLKKDRDFKSKIIWENKKIINDKILKLPKLPNWEPKHSNLENLKNFILRKRTF